jgi:glycosyltransferase involved in cell wall biosynthesis
MTQSKSVTVIIPSANRLNIIREVIPSYLSQDYIDELIIVNDSINEDYSEIESLSPLVKVVSTTGRIGAPASRNIGLKNAKNHYILFGEDDAFLSQSYISDSMQYLLVNPRDAVSGTLVDMKPAESFHVVGDRVAQFKSYDKSTYFDRKLLFISHDFRVRSPEIVPLTHALFMFNRNEHSSLMFYEGYSRAIGFREESDLQMSIQANGGHIVLLPNIYAAHMSRLDVRVGGQRVSRYVFYFYSIRDTLIFLYRHRKVIKLKKIGDSYVKNSVIYIYALSRLALKKILND